MTETDEVIVDLGFDQPGTLTHASVNYRALIDNRWHEVVRYDDAHGIPHTHRFWAKQAVRLLPVRTNPTALIDLAKEDLRENWLTYRRRLEATL